MARIHQDIEVYYPSIHMVKLQKTITLKENDTCCFKTPLSVCSALLQIDRLPLRNNGPVTATKFHSFILCELLTHRICPYTYSPFPYQVSYVLLQCYIKCQRWKRWNNCITSKLARLARSILTVFFWVKMLCRLRKVSVYGLKMETVCFSETLGSTPKSTRRHNPEM
jgi:hypothetical protein